MCNQVNIIDIRDFQTAGVVAFTEATPFSRLRSGKHIIQGQKTQVDGGRKQECENAIQQIVRKL